MVEGVRAAVEFELEVVDMGGVPDLVALYRQLLPAIVVDGELAFTWFVDAEALRERLEAVPPADRKDP